MLILYSVNGQWTAPYLLVDHLVRTVLRIVWMFGEVCYCGLSSASGTDECTRAANWRGNSTDGGALRTIVS